MDTKSIEFTSLLTNVYTETSLLPTRKGGKWLRTIIERRFDSVLDKIAASPVEDIDQVPYSRWILDNSHLIRQALQQVETDLPPSYHRQLSKVGAKNRQEAPRIFILIQGIVAKSQLPIDCNFIEDFCRDYEARNEVNSRLTLGELWAVPIALRVLLILLLCETAELIQSQRTSLAPSKDLRSSVIDVEKEVAVVAGCVTSLRTVASFPWPSFVEKTSLVEGRLCDDPSGAYPLMDFQTRDFYRQEVETLAKCSAFQQWQVADTATQLASIAKDKGQPLEQHHVGYYLIDEGRPLLEKALVYHPSVRSRLKRRISGYSALLYPGSIIGFAVLSALVLFNTLISNHISSSVALIIAVFAIIPLMSVASGIVNFIVSLLIPPFRLPKMDFNSGIPTGHETLIVVPMLLSHAEEITENLATLEQNYLGNSDVGLRFALLSDFTDSPTETAVDDDSLLNMARAGIKHLNDRYATDDVQPFFLLHRRRMYNENSNIWMGWERKRGKLEELNALLRGATDTSYDPPLDDELNSFAPIRYVITLDADSYMPTGTAQRLVGSMAHPLNCARFDPLTEELVAGYTVLQPRLEINPVSSSDNLFTKIFAGDTMLDLYTNAVSDVYQDLFATGVFAGKGIYDVDAFRRSVEGKIPVNTVLSHDLLEGLHGRAGLVSDIVLLENYPSNYLIYLKRMHRWIRGDWQLLPWLVPFSKQCSPTFKPGLIGRWQLFDNLRRSLVSPAIFALLLITWFSLGDQALGWTLLFALVPGLPILLRVTLALRTSLWRWGTIASSTRNLLSHAGADVARWALALAFLPAEAYVASDAAIRTLYRVTLSRRDLLEWSTAATVARLFGNVNRQAHFWRELWIAPLSSVILLIGVTMYFPQALPAATAFIGIWLVSPLIAFSLSPENITRPAHSLTPEDERLSRNIARDTWRFFERFVGPESHWLPPDNVQLYPTQMIAERTSPTNIGMMLLSTITAYEMGYVGQRELLARFSNHVETLNRLAKYRGHLFNWYSTSDLSPLDPTYVSTVDSGNFIAALISVRQALIELPFDEQPAEQMISALNDEIEALQNELFVHHSIDSGSDTLGLRSQVEQMKRTFSETRDIAGCLKQIDGHQCDQIESAFLDALESNSKLWSSEEIRNFRENIRVFRQRIRRMLTDLELYRPWLAVLATPPALLKTLEYQHFLDRLNRRFSSIQCAKHFAEQSIQLAALLVEVRSAIPAQEEETAIKDMHKWLDVLQRNINSAKTAYRALERSRTAILKSVEEFVSATDFRFLYDANRNLFRVGYHANTGEPDASYYDLLASEARIASIVAIALGQVPAKHWIHLGRPLTRLRGLRILLSWSATAFEYLMPRLMVHSPTSGLIDQSCDGVVLAQIRFGKAHGIPWGVSESGYAQLDQQNHYQYYAFGIPKLGLKWDQGERLVVSSYASILALPYAPAEVLRNVRALRELGASGQYGLYEALDFGDAHKPRLDRPQIVQSYMSHHQGMILVAIGNLLHNDSAVSRFHRDPHIASVEHLLYERLPQRAETRPLERLPFMLKERQAHSANSTEWQTRSDIPELCVLSNSKLSCRVPAQGGGGLYWREQAVTRWNPVAEGMTSGAAVYLMDLDEERLSCFGRGPLPESVETYFAPHSAEFRARRHNLLVRMRVCISPSSDIEVRRITLNNDGQASRRILLSSYSEPVLGDENADRRHPAFSKMFIESQFLKNDQTLLFNRRPREAEPPSMYLAHTAIAPQEAVLWRGVEVDRGAFLGRGNRPNRPAALCDPTYVASNEISSTLDPCAAMLIALEVPARSTVQCTFLSAVGERRTDVLDAVRMFKSVERTDWVASAARLHSERELTGLRIDSDLVRSAFRLLAKITCAPSLAHIRQHEADQLSRIQDSLWRQGISGDLPIITLRVQGEDDLGSVELVLKCLAYLSHKSVAIDLIIVDETQEGYTTQVNDRLRRMLETQLPPRSAHNQSSGFIIPSKNISATEKLNLIASARLFIDSRSAPNGQTITSTIDAPAGLSGRMPAFVPQPSSPLSNVPIADVIAHDNLLFKNRFGGLLSTYDGYSLIISNRSPTPAPWCNVLANPHFGTLVSETGTMCTWWGNSSENRLTPWHNDPVLDGTGEALYVRDEESGRHWALTPRADSGNVPYRVTHEIGESVFEHNREGLVQELRIFVDPEQALKTMRVRLENKWSRARRLTITFAVEWVLGNTHTYNRHLLLPERDEETGALLVRNAYDRHATGEVAFIASDFPAHSVCTLGSEFLGQHCAWSQPPGITAVGLSDRIEPSAEPCAVYQVHVDMQANASCEVHFMLGAALDQKLAREFVKRAQEPGQAESRRQALKRAWNKRLGVWSVNTPDLATNAMLNRWLLYQVTSARLWGRIGFYQASGGYGFRDQLQDVLALLDSEPEIARQQILLSASRQFQEGDVLHWWHEAPLRGVRTRCSDDLLWLPFAVSEYVAVTDDESILNDLAPFLQAQVLAEHEQERYAEFQSATENFTIYEHCWRAIDARLMFGAHGMPYIGTGDWNDGLNRVGEKGRGESVWMAWFLIHVCRHFAPLCREMNDHWRAEHYEKTAEELLNRTRESAWTGDWYLRAYFDNGEPLGAPGNDESEIDLNAQTWAALVDPEHHNTHQAMRAAEQKLCDEDARLIKLLAPPFEKSMPDPGYIRAYPPGVRENGGQYTHAAVWAAWAAVALGDKDNAWRWFEWLNPLKRARNDDEIDQYRLEPYVMPGDVYGTGPLKRRGGWSWYSGSAAWLYRYGIRQFLGLQRRGNRLFLRPCVPDDWPKFDAVLKYGDAEHHLNVHAPSHYAPNRLFLVKDTELFDVPSISLLESGSHHYEIFPTKEARSDWLLSNKRLNEAR